MIVMDLPLFLVKHMGVKSKSEAKRLIKQGAVKIDGKTCRDNYVLAGEQDKSISER